MDEWLSDEIMQNISMENNLADTAFAVRRKDGDYDLRWFMPEAEIKSYFILKVALFLKSEINIG